MILQVAVRPICDQCEISLKFAWRRIPFPGRYESAVKGQEIRHFVRLPWRIMVTKTRVCVVKITILNLEFVLSVIIMY